DLAAYYRAFRARMSAWEEAFPGCATDLYYERLIEHPQAELERLLALVDMEYEEACLDFAQSSRFVPTISQVQVREPLNRKGVGRWRHYEDALRPLGEKLAEFEAQYEKELEGSMQERNTFARR